MNKVNFDNVGFVYKFWYKFFELLDRYSMYTFFSEKIFKNTSQFSDRWVIFNTIFSFISMIVLNNNKPSTLGYFVAVYGAIRLFEMVVYQINVLLFHPYRSLVIKNESYNIQNPYRSVVLLGHNFIEVIFWFTAISSAFVYNGNSTFFNFMVNSIRIFTFDFEIDSSNKIQVLVFLEVIFGLILTVISLAKFIGELPHSHLELGSEQNKKIDSK